MPSSASAQCPVIKPTIIWNLSTSLIFTSVKRLPRLSDMSRILTKDGLPLAIHALALRKAPLLLLMDFRLPTLMTIFMPTFCNKTRHVVNPNLATSAFIVANLAIGCATVPRTHKVQFARRVPTRTSLPQTSPLLLPPPRIRRRLIGSTLLPRLVLLIP